MWSGSNSGEEDVYHISTLDSGSFSLGYAPYVRAYTVRCVLDVSVDYCQALQKDTAATRTTYGQAQTPVLRT